MELQKNPREVAMIPLNDCGLTRYGEITDTLYSETFCNQPRAGYWLKDRSFNKKPSRDDVCKVIATVGNIMVMMGRQKDSHGMIDIAYAAKNDIWKSCGGLMKMVVHGMNRHWARENGCPWDERTCADAASNGHLEVLKWARENRCPWNEGTCGGAASPGHAEILKWARENGCPWNEWTSAYAAKNGHLAVLRWARENGCPWDEWTCTYAAESGHLDILKWARENGCPWDEQTYQAASNGHWEALLWENGCPWEEQTYEAARRS
ncbi:ankyrin repeat protein [Seminavis robusta]|uniref:Ankyrin repeat protein n=1 Tax=Seminavis robusta TaxID=568900 RepID=A0A9N8HQW1_9STRA|nr:ankyrin repeat protein [Seminavis robusta]|eukprot:Sro1021_g232250.1 ankyrin repeat protein (264) ;mRNA; f:19945-20857